MSESVDTKKIIANAFKELMKRKALRKITVSDITSYCGFNRQTFYYYFKDKYELLNWIFYNEVAAINDGKITAENWESRMLRLLVIIQKDARFYSNAINSEYGNEFLECVFHVCTEIYSSILERTTKNICIDSDGKRFVSEFFSYGLSGTIIGWVRAGMKIPPEDIVMNMKNVIDDSRTFLSSKYSE